MRKKWWMMGAGIGLGAVMLVAGGLSAMAGSSGYDAYKAAMKNTKASASLASAGSIVVTDNGEEIWRAELDAKIDRQRQAMSASVTLNADGKRKQLQMYRQDGQIVTTEAGSGLYRLIETDGSPFGHRGEREFGPPAHAERIVDALMGNLKTMATVEAAPGGRQQASLHLTGNRIPAVAQAIGAIASSKLAEPGPLAGHGPLADGAYGPAGGDDACPLGDLRPALPVLTEEVRVDSILLDAGIDEAGRLDRQQATLAIVGTDADGEEHELIVAVDIRLSGFDGTVPDTVDLTGKQVEKIDAASGMPRWGH